MDIFFIWFSLCFQFCRRSLAGDVVFATGLQLDEVCERFNGTIHSWRLMTNHYHLLLETPDGNLSRGMRQLNGVYTLRRAF